MVIDNFCCKLRSVNYFKDRVHSCITLAVATNSASADYCAMHGSRFESFCTELFSEK